MIAVRHLFRRDARDRCSPSLRATSNSSPAIRPCPRRAPDSSCRRRTAAQALRKSSLRRNRSRTTTFGLSRRKVAPRRASPSGACVIAGPPTRSVGLLPRPLGIWRCGAADVGVFGFAANQRVCCAAGVEDDRVFVGVGGRDREFLDERSEIFSVGSFVQPHKPIRPGPVADAVARSLSPRDSPQPDVGLTDVVWAFPLNQVRREPGERLMVIHARVEQLNRGQQHQFAVRGDGELCIANVAARIGKDGRARPGLRVGAGEHADTTVARAAFVFARLAKCADEAIAISNQARERVVRGLVRCDRRSTARGDHQRPSAGGAWRHTNAAPKRHANLVRFIRYERTK